MNRPLRSRAARLVVAGSLLAGPLLGVSAPAHAAVTVDGAGSTWSSIAVTQWAADVARQGLSINFQANGSTAGRTFYYSSQVDFAVSEIPFQEAYQDATGTVTTNEISLASKRPYSYMPIVAGGTSFMYNLQINGQRFTNLHLSPDAVSKIFTGAITKWNDPAIAADNPGVPLPAIAVKPVIRSDGSGTSAQFTAYMASEAPGVWQAFCQKVNLGGCRPTSLYPEFDGSTAQQFSDGVAAYVAAPYNNGAITYVEYGYAKQRGFPVASILNAAGYYAQPTPQAVAIALQGATLNPDRTQVLTGVYRNADPRAYPVSSYSYMIVPTTTDRPFSAERQIPGAPAPPAIESCANPTITGDFVTGAAPLPPASAKKGAAATGGVRPGAGVSGATGVAGASGAEGTTGAGGGTVLDGQLLAASRPLDVKTPAQVPAWTYVLIVGLLALVVAAPPTVALILRRRRAGS